jgi:hypothetical protein
MSNNNSSSNPSKQTPPVPPRVNRSSKPNENVDSFNNQISRPDKPPRNPFSFSLTHNNTSGMGGIPQIPPIPPRSTLQYNTPPQPSPLISQRTATVGATNNNEDSHTTKPQSPEEQKKPTHKLTLTKSAPARPIRNSPVTKISEEVEVEDNINKNSSNNNNLSSECDMDNDGSKNRGLPPVPKQSFSPSSHARIGKREDTSSIGTSGTRGSFYTVRTTNIRPNSPNLQEIFSNNNSPKSSNITSNNNNNSDSNNHTTSNNQLRNYSSGRSSNMYGTIQVKSKPQSRPGLNSSGDWNYHTPNKFKPSPQMSEINRILGQSLPNIKSNEPMFDSDNDNPSDNNNNNNNNNSNNNGDNYNPNNIDYNNSNNDNNNDNAEEEEPIFVMGAGGRPLMKARRKRSSSANAITEGDYQF